MTLLSTAQAATHIGRDRRTVQWLITSGQLRAVKIGRDYVIDEADLAALPERRRGPKPRKAG